MITAVFNNGINSVNVYGLWQWDYGQVLQIKGLTLPAAVEIHFSDQQEAGEAERCVGVTEDGTTIVTIPNRLLEENGVGLRDYYYLYAFIYLADEASGETIKRIKMHVKKRPKPKYFEPKPEEEDIFHAVVSAVNQAADRAEDAADRAEADAEEIAGDRVAVEEAAADFTAQSGQAVQILEAVKTAAVSEVQKTGGAALEEIGSAQKTAESVIKETHEASVSDVTDTGDEQVQKVETAGTKSLEAVEKAGQHVLQAIADADAALTNQVDALAPGIEVEVKGSSISVQDASDRHLKGLHVYGKSTQVTTKGYQLLKDTWAEIFKQPMESVVVDGEGYFKFIIDYKVNAEFSTLFSDISKIIPQMNDDDVVYIRFNKIASKETYNYQATFKTSDGKDVCETSRNGSIVSTTYGVLKNSRIIQFYFYNNTQSVTASVGDTFQFIISKNPKCEYEPYTGGKPSPSIEYPQEIVSAGDKGEIGVSVYGGNLIPETQIVDVGFNKKDNGAHYGYSEWINVVPDNTYIFNENMIVKIVDTLGNVVFEGQTTNKKVIIPHDGVRLICRTVAGINSLGSDFKLMMNIGDKILPFEPYKEPQTLKLKTPNGLPGIPVSTGGNYTDSTGQQWITDEIDFAREKYVQRIYRCVKEDFRVINFGGTGNYFIVCTNTPTPNTIKGLCNLTNNKSNSWVNGEEPHYFLQKSGQKVAISAGKDYNSIEKMEEIIDRGIEFIYPMETPIETDLPPEVIEQYKKLRTNYPVTAITNDVGAEMRCRYIADTKKYIDNKFAELSNVVLNAVTGGK